ncbi:hypothetical protein MAALD49_38580 [Marinobacter shengliensis]|nr:hypothetical protein MAALD49_38580 [Marinobacter shengliensis]
MSLKMRNQVFVSYSHRDSDYLARLKVHLRPFERQGLVELWSDSKIGPGDRWKREIAEAIDRAAAAVLLISADFLASDFVAENELPPLLSRAEEEGVKILPVVLKPCAFTDIEEISQFQSVNDPKRTVAELSEADSESLWYGVAAAVRDAIQKVEAEQPSEQPVKSPYDEPFIEKFGGSYVGLFTEELSNPEVINDFAVYEYSHVDELSYMPRADDMIGHVEGFDEALKKVKEKFRRAGWEGDGAIRLMWLPPFVGAGIEDTWGLGIWFVKQSNNGTAFMASPVPLPFSRLLEQNT